MFAYSMREKTRAARRMEDDVPPEVKKRRLQASKFLFYVALFFPFLLSLHSHFLGVCTTFLVFILDLRLSLGTLEEEANSAIRSFSNVYCSRTSYNFAQLHFVCVGLSQLFSSRISVILPVPSRRR